MLPALTAVQVVAHRLCAELISAKLIKSSGHSQTELAGTFCLVARLLCDAIYGAILNAVPYEYGWATDAVDNEINVPVRQVCEADLADLAKLRNQLPVDWLAHVYEDLLGYRSDSQSRLTLESGNRKKRSGSFYTPYELAQFTVDIALKNLVWDAEAGLPRPPQDILAIRLVDPCLGGGTFLCAALTRLTDALVASIEHFPGSAGVPPASTFASAFPGSAGVPPASNPDIAPELSRLRAAIAVNCLHGVDIDPGAVEISKLSIATMCGEYAAFVLPALNENLKCGNSLLALNPVASFNWHAEFPAIFSDGAKNLEQLGRLPCGGFDAVVGNPPWEIEKANSREFFQDYITDYWQMGKQEALCAAAELCAQDQTILRLWTEYEKEYESFSDFISNGQVFTLQGSSDPNAYKLFVELAYQIARDTGIVSLVVPSGIYTDKGSALIRDTLLHKCNWKSIHGFHNNRGIFKIHRSFKFCVLTFEKGGSSEEMLLNLDNDSVSGAREKIALVCPRATVERFSPKHFSILDVSSQKDLELLEKISAQSITLDTFLRERNFRFSREFDMTNDSPSFELRHKLEENGYVPDVYGHWIAGGWRSIRATGTNRPVDTNLATDTNGATDTNRPVDTNPATDTNPQLNPNWIASRDGQFVLALEDIESVAYPLYEGRMLSHFDDAAKGWVAGKGRRAIWTPGSSLNPQYLVLADKLPDRTAHLKVGYLAVGSPTNSRSMIAACLGGFPCGNSVPVLRSPDASDSLLLAALLNSFVFDYVLRLKMSGNNVNFFLLQECFAPAKLYHAEHMVALACLLSLGHPRHAPTLLELISQPQSNVLENLAKFVDWSNDDSSNEAGAGHSQPFSVDANLKISLRSILDACMALSFRLEYDDLGQILAQCNLPSSDLKKTRSLSLFRYPKGFWRVDKHLPPDERHTVRTLSAFKRIENVGVEQVLRETLERLPSNISASELAAHQKRLAAIRAHSH